MARRIELTISTDYVSWDSWECVREFLSNAKDEDVRGFRMTVRHQPERSKGILSIRNDGATLSLDKLLLGATTKRGDASMIGTFGEGFKLAAIGLLKVGYTIKVFTSGQVWVPALEESRQFPGSIVLVWNIADGRAKGTNAVVVEIDGVSAEVWTDIKSRVLWLDAPFSGEVIDTDAGRVLLSDRFKGLLFVKGVSIGKLPGDYTYGYDIKDVTLDRDRRLADPWGLKSRLASVWDHAIARQPELAGGFLATLAAGAADGGNSEYHYFSPEARTALKNAFTSKHGENAVPVTSLGDAQALDHLGVDAVVVTKAELAVLKDILPQADTVRGAKEKEASRVYQLNELDGAEKVILMRAVELIDSGIGTGSKLLDSVSVVDFFGPAIAGTHRPGEIRIARKLLLDPVETLSTLAHEAAHTVGGDGSVNHERAIETILARACWIAATG